MEKVVDLFYSKSRFKDKIIAVKQLCDLLLTELDNENIDLYIIFDYLHEITGKIAILIRWIKYLRLEELAKELNNKDIGNGEMDK
jgi:hypothetical protein